MSQQTDASAPDGFIIRKSQTNGDNSYDYANKYISEGYLFGPFEGRIIAEEEAEEIDFRQCWKVMMNDGRVSHYLDGCTRDVSNWLSLVRLSEDITESNMAAFQFNQRIFYYSRKEIQIGDKLVVWHGDEDGGTFAPTPLTNEEGQLGFLCNLCGDVYVSPALLDGHRRYCKRGKQLRSQKMSNPGKQPLFVPTMVEGFAPSARKKAISRRKGVESDGVAGRCKVDMEDDDTNDGECSYSSKTSDGDHVSAVDKPFSCDYCERTFAWSSHKKIHMRTHTGEKPFVCSICDKGFGRNFQLKLHLRVHTEERPHTCVTCDKGFKQKWALKMHELSHLEEMPFKCIQCNKAFATEKRLQKHGRIHNGDRPHVCTTCGLAFTQQRHLQGHMEVHRDVQPHVCQECGSRFSRKAALVQHKFVHSQEKPFSCEHCHKEFSLRSSLRRHILTHSGELPFTCDICGKKWAVKSKLQRHLDTHNEEKNHHCDQCGKSFKSQELLAGHSRTHSGKRRFCCEECDKSFLTKSAWKTHMERHTLIELPKCEICDKTFASSQSLKHHQITHSDKKPYKCGHCGKEFKRKQTMKDHIKTHLDVKPFACDKCERTFVRKDYLEQHKKAHYEELLVSYQLQKDFEYLKNGFSYKGRKVKNPHYDFPHFEQFLQSQDRRRERHYVCGQCKCAFDKYNFRLHKVKHLLGFGPAWKQARCYQRNTERYPYYALEEIR